MAMPIVSKTKILVSACLMGQPVRYDGKYASTGLKQLELLQKQGRIVLLCPETAAGLPIPRPAAEIKKGRVVTNEDQDMTGAFITGAQKALDLCLRKGIKTAILKENSPSCGSKYIYDGSFSGTRISGEGKVTELLRANNIKVFSEYEIDIALKSIS
ncbi:DUF523 domain-containing protein [Kiloniella sp.]|uniref:DUF523 domain-containing protein n=1 Tax=Kiloniella sp. TaxID=1938587 RepID=UPI003B01CC19